MKNLKVMGLGMAGAFFGVMLLAGMAFWADIFKVDQNGAIYLRVTDTGNVGIGNPAPDPGSRLVVHGTGTTSATSALDVQDGNGTSQLFVRDDNNIFVGRDSIATTKVRKVYSTNHAAGNVPSQLDMGIDDGSFAGMSLKDVRDGSFNSQSLEFSTHHGGVTAGTRMTIDKDGKVGIGTTGPDSILELGGADAAMSLNEDSATPASPASGAEARVYMKADKLVIQYNDGGTVRYKYLDLTGTGVTWTHTTTAP